MSDDAAVAKVANSRGWKMSLRSHNEVVIRRGRALGNTRGNTAANEGKFRLRTILALQRMFKTEFPELHDPRSCLSRRTFEGSYNSTAECALHQFHGLRTTAERPYDLSFRSLNRMTGPRSGHPEVQANEQKSAAHPRQRWNGKNALKHLLR